MTLDSGEAANNGCLRYLMSAFFGLLTFSSSSTFLFFFVTVVSPRIVQRKGSSASTCLKLCPSTDHCWLSSVPPLAIMPVISKYSILSAESARNGPERPHSLNRSYTSIGSICMGVAVASHRHFVFGETWSLSALYRFPYFGASEAPPLGLLRLA